ncbi:MAG: division/cell wall cluster transcriptional repressor MraZ [Desulfotalea sp.]
MLVNNRFRSRSRHTLDAKGRMNFPKRFCDVLDYFGGREMMICPWSNDHLRIYTLQAWNELEDKYYSSAGNPKLLQWARRVLGGVVACSLDKQGRLLIPQALREESGVEADICLNALGNFVEIWDNDTFERVTNPEESEDTSQALFDLGIM